MGSLLSDLSTKSLKLLLLKTEVRIWITVPGIRQLTQRVVIHISCPEIRLTDNNNIHAM